MDDVVMNCEHDHAMQIYLDKFIQAPNFSKCLIFYSPFYNPHIFYDKAMN